MRTHMQRSRIALLLAVALGCSDITNRKQQDPTRLLTKDVYKPEQAALLVNGAIGDFECAFFRYTTAAGLLGDELVNAFANTANYTYDRRTLLLTGPYAGGCGGHPQPGGYTPPALARAPARTLPAPLQGVADAPLAPRADPAK